jgi:hypothetical protein
MSSGIKSWLNISPSVASSPQCVTQAYEIHSQGVGIIMLGDHGRDLSCSLYFWGPKSVLTPVRSDALRQIRSHASRLLLQQHPVTGRRVGDSSRCSLWANASSVLMSRGDVRRVRRGHGFSPRREPRLPRAMSAWLQMRCSGHRMEASKRIQVYNSMGGA